jgi:hypothetical protein
MNYLFGILLALGCALTTNIGFLYKHRGACAAARVDMRHPFKTARSLFKVRMFTIGMLIGSAAWVFHVAAMAAAPLSVVQSVLAGGVVLLAVMAERVLGVRVGRRQWAGLTLTAGGLILLGLTLPGVHGAHSRFSVPGMIAFEFGLIGAGALLIMGPRMGARAEHHGFMTGAASGILFGVSDIGVKALSGMIGAHGITGLLSPWLLLTLAAGVAAFYAAAKAFQDGEAVPVIAVTSTAANVAGIVGGIIVFGDPLSGNPLLLGVECLAFLLVLSAAWLMPAPMRTAGAVAAG